MSNEMRLISKAGKTFYFATFWLPKLVRHDAARAYDFCRTIDDIADANPCRVDRDTLLEAIYDAVLRGDTSHDMVRPLCTLLDRFPETREPFAALVEACRRDVPGLHINSERDLEQYAHGVAGNVGLIMYPILGGRSDLGRSYAADLGIAMQYTNIARDIREDRRCGRTYLPSCWLWGVTDPVSSEIATHDEPTIAAAIEQLLSKADERYRRGLSGLTYLAPENRFAIRVAAECYRAIGKHVIQGATLARQRAVVSTSEKLLIACKTAIQRHSSSPTTMHTGAGSATHTFNDGSPLNAHD